MTHPTYFLYDTAFAEVKRSKAAQLYFHGWYGVGKTAFLKKCEEHFSNALFLHGKDWEVTYAILESLDSEKLPPCILFDDMDEFAHLALHFGFAESFVDVMRLLANLIFTNKSRFIATGTLSLDDLINQDDREEWTTGWSFFESKLSQKSLYPWGSFLRPWDAPWKKRQENFLKQCWQEKFSKVTEASDQEVWLEQMFEVTGGHPSLVQGIVNTLFPDSEKQSASAFEQWVLEQKGSPDFAFQMKQYLLDILLSQDISFVRKSLRSLKKLPIPQVIDSLIAMVEGDNAKIPRLAEKNLMDRLLIRRLPTGRYEIPGELLSHEISKQSVKLLAKATSSSSRPEFEVSLKPDSLEPDKRGVVCFGKGKDAVQVHLSKASWWIMKLLVDSPRGEIISISQFVEKTELGGEKAFRSAKQRLDLKLKEEKVENAIESVKGQGYRLRVE